MARKPQRSAKAAPKSAPALPPPGGTDREKIIAAFMALLAEKRFEQIGFGDIAARAGLTLAICRAEFGSTLAILAAHMKELDRKVLAGAERRHGRGAAARAAVRRADAAHRGDGAVSRGDRAR